MNSSNQQDHVVKAPVRCAVIGLGMGRGHAHTFMKCDNAKLVAVVDLETDRLAGFESELGKEALFTDYREMLKHVKPDLVMIALPNYLHKSVTLDALEAGAHVLCEKPMAMTVAEAEEMLAAAKSCKRRLGINFSQRFSPAHRTLKQIADSGALGDIYHGYCSWTRRDNIPRFGGWFGQKELSGGGPLIDLGVHRIDLSMWLMGHPKVVSVSGVIHHRLGVPRGKEQGKSFDVEDFATGLVRFDNGASLILEVSWVGHQREKETQQMRIMGTQGALEMDHGYFHYSRQGDAFCTTAIDVETAQARSSCQEMVHCLVTGKPFWGAPEHGINVQRVLNGLYESAATGRDVVFE